MPTPHTTSNKVARALASYADILQGLGNLQEEMEEALPSQTFNLDRNPISGRRCQAMCIKSEYVMEEITQASNMQTENNTTPIMVTQESLTEQLETFRAEIMVSNKKLFVDREQKMQEEMEVIITTKLESAQKALTARFTNSMQEVMKKEKECMDNIIKQQMTQTDLVL